MVVGGQFKLFSPHKTTGSLDFAVDFNEASPEEGGFERKGEGGIMGYLRAHLFFL